ncbi:MAG: hypothetical protein AAF532_06845 [Planctomycetota bacterium]
MSTAWERLSTADRMVLAVEKVRERLLKTTAALTAGGVRHAIAGGNAVAAHVARVEPAAVRNTQDVDVLLDRDDLSAAEAAMTAAGFEFRHAGGVSFFREPGGKFRDAVHLVFAGEKVRDEYVAAAPGLDEVDTRDAFPVVSLEALVRMKLTSFRDKDRTHLRDFIDVGLIDASWPGRFVADLGDRLQALLDDPDG